MKNETALNEYLFDLKLRNCSTRTVRSAKNNMALFLCWLETEYNLTAIEDIKRVHIKGYLHYKQSLGLKPTYINSILKNVKAFFNYMVREEYLSTSPASQIKLQKEEKVLIQTFTAAETKRMLSIYDTSNFLNSRNRCMITMLFDTGIRNYELCSIKCEDIRERTILIHGKGSKQRLVPISPLLRKAMLKYEIKRENYIRERWNYETDYYFLSQKGRRLTPETVERVVKDCGIAAHVDEKIRCSPHTCRHTFAQMCLKNGLDVYIVSRLLGHENISITKRYLQSIEDSAIIDMAITSSPLMKL